jgi:ABC-type antimicrobial peptide transport system permease subunit
VLILAIGISGWVQYARTVRGSTLVEKNKEYVQAARVIGRPPLAIMLRHVLPNVTGPVLVIATIHIATAIIPRRRCPFWSRRSAYPSVARHADPHRQRVPALGGMVDHGVSRHRPRAAGCSP